MRYTKTKCTNILKVHPSLCGIYPTEKSCNKYIFYFFKNNTWSQRRPSCYLGNTVKCGFSVWCIDFSWNQLFRAALKYLALQKCGRILKELYYWKNCMMLVTKCVLQSSQKKFFNCMFQDFNWRFLFNFPTVFSIIIFHKTSARRYVHSTVKWRNLFPYLIKKTVNQKIRLRRRNISSNNKIFLTSFERYYQDQILH